MQLKLWIIAVVAAATTSLPAQQPSAPIRFERCGNAPRVVECTQFDVRERPGDASSRLVSLRIVRIRQDSTAPATTATFVLAGGPGSPATAMARGDITGY